MDQQSEISNTLEEPTCIRTSNLNKNSKGPNLPLLRLHLHLFFFPSLPFHILFLTFSRPLYPSPLPPPSSLPFLPRGGLPSAFYLFYFSLPFFFPLPTFLFPGGTIPPKGTYPAFSTIQPALTHFSSSPLVRGFSVTPSIPLFIFNLDLLVHSRIRILAWSISTIALYLDTGHI